LDISYRRPGATVVAAHSVVVGDRAPDAPLRRCQDGRPAASVTRLFDVIRRDEFSLLLVGGDHPLAHRYDEINRITAGFPIVSVYIVLPGMARSADVSATALIDVGDTLRRKYGIDGEAMLLIRPDGYVAARHDHWDATELTRTLNRWLLPANSTLMEEA